MSTVNLETGANVSNTNSKVTDLIQKGISLNSGDVFNQEAFDLLKRAVKLDPCHMDAWVELAKCHQKNADIEGAIDCLRDAIKNCEADTPNKTILRELSTCIRQKTCSSQEDRIANLLESLELSKQALKLDLLDGENYYNLAKAYMCLFFATECVDHRLIYLSKTAYSKALSLSDDNLINISQLAVGDDSLNKNTSRQKELNHDQSKKSFIEQTDFLYNYSTVLIYLQEFQQALEYLRLAIKPDANWDEPKILEESLADYLKQIGAMMNELSKNNRKLVKRFYKIIETLKDVNAIEKTILLDQQRLFKLNDLKLAPWNLKDLKKQTICDDKSRNDKMIPDSDSNCKAVVNILHLKLVYTVNYNQAMYLTFIAMDQDYSLVVVTIYNLAASKCPRPRDVVTIIEPKIEEIAVTTQTSAYGDINITFERINVREFKHLYVNGSRITTDQVSKPQCKVSVLT